MKRYALVLWSFETYTVKIFESIFNNTVLGRLIFPAKFYFNKGKEIIRLETPSDFSTDLISEENFSKESGRTSLSLYPENGIAFHSSIYSLVSKYPNVISLHFTSEHIKNSICTLSDIIKLLEEGTGSFKIGQAYLEDTEGIKIPEPDGGYSFLKPPTYKRPSGGEYLYMLDWLTYFGEDYLHIIGDERFENLKTYYLKQEIDNGILVVLQEKPFDNSNPNHLSRKEKAEIELGFIK